MYSPCGDPVEDGCEAVCTHLAEILLKTTVKLSVHSPCGDPVEDDCEAVCTHLAEIPLKTAVKLSVLTLRRSR